MNQVQMREAEIQRLHRVMQQADRNAYEAQNAARVAAEELARAQFMNVGAAPRVATPPPQLVGSPACHRMPPRVGQPSYAHRWILVAKARDTIERKT